MGCFDKTYTDFTYNSFTYNINTFNITCMFFILCYKNSHSLVKSVISNDIIINVTHIKYFKYGIMRKVFISKKTYSVSHAILCTVTV